VPLWGAALHGDVDKRVDKAPRHRLAAMRGRFIPYTEPVKIARLGNPIVDTE
jgi:hypothetical protein